jgi:hypothetical protein
MKRLSVMIMLTVLGCAWAGTAGAVELKARGTWRVQFNAIKNPAFNDKEKVDVFSAMQRMHTAFDFIAGENLKAVLQLEIGDLTWGDDEGGGLNADGINIKTRHAYLDFTLPGPNTAVKVGIQDLALPSSLGSHILEADVAALAAYQPFSDAFGLTLGWARPHDMDQVNPTDATKNWDDEVDVFLAVLPVNLDGISLNPFAALTRWGKDFNLYELDNPKDAAMWHGGLNLEMTMLDPLTVMADMNYGHVKWADDFKQSGWIADLVVQYALDMFTPELLFLYESGEGANFQLGNKSKRMPTIGTDGGSVSIGNVGYGGGTEFAQDNFLRGLLVEMDPMGYQADEGAVGLWALGAALRDISFVEDLSHEFVATYARGTNHKNNAMLMTTKDSYWEVDFNTRWQMYENLAVLLELAYGKADLDDMGAARDDLAKDALYRGVLGMVYEF